MKNYDEQGCKCLIVCPGHVTRILSMGWVHVWKLRMSRTKLGIVAKSENCTLERGYNRPQQKIHLYYQ